MGDRGASPTSQLLAVVGVPCCCCCCFCCWCVCVCRMGDTWQVVDDRLERKRAKCFRGGLGKFSPSDPPSLEKKRLGK